MAGITLRVLDGADRGRVYADLAAPITIGREEGNAIQLNDERISRFHVKIQEDQGKLVLTDLESTNGTKVNGEVIHVRILRHGDVISVGRSVLLFGTREEIAQRLARLRDQGRELGDSASGTVFPDEIDDPRAFSLDFELNWSDDPDLQSTLHALMPPELPERLSPSQAAELAELLEFFHVRLRDLLAAVRTDPNEEEVRLKLRQWQSLLDLQARLAEYLRAISNPHG